MLAIKMSLKPLFLRAKPNEDRTKHHQAKAMLGKVQSYGVGRTMPEAKANAAQLMSVHIHALNAADAVAHRATTHGIPQHYRLGGEA